MNKTFVKPFHKFGHHGKWYLINIEDMSACSIDKETTRTLEIIANAPGTPAKSKIRGQLKSMGLLPEDESTTKREVKDELTKEPIPVVTMALFLTQSCNLECIYCYGGGGRYGTGGCMEQKTAYRAVDWLIERSRKVKNLRIDFFGGEPLIEFSLMEEVVEYAKKRAQEMGKKVFFHVTTNGSLLNDKIIAFLQENNISIQVSFDGPREIQDSQRPFADGRRSYDVIVPKIKKLLESLPNSHGHAVLIGNTDPALVKDALQKIGFSEISMLPASGSQFNSGSYCSQKNRDTDGIYRMMDQESEAWISNTKSRDCEALKILKFHTQFFPGLTAFLYNRKKFYSCGAGLGLVGVSCSGDVFLCHRFVGIDSYKMGSVFHKDLDRSEYKKSPVVCSEACNACFAKYYCAGGCKYDNLISCGSIFSQSEDMCRFRRRQFELSAYISCMLDEEDRAFLAKNDIISPKPCPLDF